MEPGTASVTGVITRQQTRRREQDRLPSPSAPLRDCSSVTDASAALIGQFQPASRSDTTPRFIVSRRLSSLDPAASNFSPCPCETTKVSGSPVSFRHPPLLHPPTCSADPAVFLACGPWIWPLSVLRRPFARRYSRAPPHPRPLPHAVGHAPARLEPMAPKWRDRSCLRSTA